MNWLWAWVWGLVPVWVWIALGIAAAVVAYRMLGWRGALAVLAVTFGSVAYSRGVKTGVGAERKKLETAADKADAVLEAERQEVKAMPKSQRDKEFDSWSKHS